MAIKPFNSINGFSVSDTGNVIIDGAGNITTANIVVSQYANLGNIANVKISGGSNGYVVSTDGAGNLSFIAQTGGSNTSITSPMPTFVDVGETYYVTANHQGLFGVPITIDGTLEVDGVLVDVNAASTSLNATVANVIITGGTSGQYLQTDGTGNLSWAAGGGGGSGSPGGVTTQVQFNDAGSFAGNAGFTFNKTTGTLSATYFSGAGNALSNIQVANVSGLGNIATTNLDGNASNVLYGNGVFSSAPGGSYGNSNVATFLASYGSNTITTTGNIRAGNLLTGSNITATSTYMSLYTPSGEQARIIDTASPTLYVQLTGGQSGVTRPSIGVAGTGASGLNIFNSGGQPIYLATSGAASNVQFVVAHTGSTVNYVQVTGANTGNRPTISAQGSDSAVGLNIVSKSNGTIAFYTNTNTLQAAINHVASAVNYINMTGANTGNAPSYGVLGTDADINVALTPKGAGNVTTTANIVATGNITGGNLTTTGILSTTGNVTFTGANVSLGAIGNVKITGGSNAYVLSTDGAGNLSWVAQSGGGGGASNARVMGYNLVFGL